MKPTLLIVNPDLSDSDQAELIRLWAALTREDILTRKDYIGFARNMGDGLAIALLHGGETARTEFYNEVYVSLCLALKAENPRFDSLRFAHATSKAEQDYLTAARECGRDVERDIPRYV